MKLKLSSSALSVTIIGVLFFIFGFITWLNGILIPYLKISCQLSYSQSFLVTFAFYISYFIMALPSGWVLKKTGFKKGISLGLMIMAVGALGFLPAAYTRSYFMFLTSLFIVGSGLALLQTASNPYVTILGPIESAAKRISIMGVANKLAGAIAPLIFAAILFNNIDEVVKSLEGIDATAASSILDDLSRRVMLPYLVIAIVLGLLSFLVLRSPLPEIKADSKEETSLTQDRKYLIQYPQLVFGVLALFLYVGAEVIAGDTIIQYALDSGYPIQKAKMFTSITLVLMMVGYFIGIGTIPRYLSQEKALMISALLGISFTIAILFTPINISVYFVALLGLANALVWPAIWPIALKGLGRHTSMASSLLIMAIAGGAILPLLYGTIADSFDSTKAYAILLFCYVFILFFSILFSQRKG